MYNSSTPALGLAITKYVFVLFFVLQYATAMTQAPFDLQGHRGCRGLMPENTLPGFIHAVETA